MLAERTARWARNERVSVVKLSFCAPRQVDQLFKRWLRPLFGCSFHKTALV